MVEQEKYKNMLQRIIEETENQNIRSSEQLIKMLISELSNNESLEKYTHSVAKKRTAF
ncbi:hypothetical protein [Oceanobacillus damuensis]|uniref:hypothetical protein n=1 Tax=Oceanobacillus damuensis TaxID=937928 RepID=UPI000A83D8D0|nr:hypothetical protein [Oceanobacillus damuensis]